jgi:hypothetical protein
MGTDERSLDANMEEFPALRGLEAYWLQVQLQ